MSDTIGLAGGRIRSFVDRIEHIESELQELSEGKKEVFAEAKNEGFDVKILREIIKLRKQDKEEREEQETLLDVYMRAMEETPSEAVRRQPEFAQGRTSGRGAPLDTDQLTISVRLVPPAQGPGLRSVACLFRRRHDERINRQRGLLTEPSEQCRRIHDSRCLFDEERNVCPGLVSSRQCPPKRGLRCVYRSAICFDEGKFAAEPSYAYPTYIFSENQIDPARGSVVKELSGILAASNHTTPAGRPHWRACV